MADKFIPLDLPPGLHRNGTKLQAAGRWYDGNRVRFHQGAIQPIGGWVKRTLTGVAITGRPNAAVSWQTGLTGSPKRLAIGTSTGLYAVDETNIVFNILPAGLVGGTPYRWTLTVFGSYLVATYALDGVDASATRNVLIWDGNTGGPASFADNGTGTLPFYVYSVVTTPERFCVLIGGSDAPGTLRRAPTGGAIYDPSAGTISSPQNGALPAPTGSAIFDPASGGVRY